MLSANSLAVAAGSFALLVGAAFLGSSAYSLFQDIKSSSTSLNTASFTWLSDIRFDVQKSTLPTSAELLVGPQLPKGFVPAQSLSYSSSAPIAAPTVVASAPIGKKRIHRAFRHLVVMTQKPQTSSTPKQVALSAPVTAPQPDSLATEMETMRKIHEGFSQRFFIAMESNIKVNTQTASADLSRPSTPSVSSSSSPRVDSQWHPVHRHTPRAAVPAPSLDEMINQDLAKQAAHTAIPAAVGVPAEETQAMPQFHYLARKNSGQSLARIEKALPAAAVASDSLGSHDEVSLSQAAPQAMSVTQEDEDHSNASLTAAEQTEFEAQAAKLWTEYSREQTALAGQQVAANGGIVVSTQTVTRNLPTQVARSGVTYSPPAQAMPTQAPMNIQPESAVALNSQAVLPQSETAMRAAAHVAASAPALAVSSRVKRVEAFDWSTPILQGSDSPFTNEETETSSVGWSKSEAADHWPTYARRSVTNVPLISNNAAKLLSAIGGSTLQSETGIVFGKIPSGWNVRLSGRAERPIVLNFNNQAVAPQSSDGDRYFAFLNAAPGAHLVYLADGSGVEQGAVAVASIGHTSTYIDLSRLSHATLQGRVLDGSNASGRPLANVTVRVLGKSSAVTQTDSRGQFQIPNVLTVGDQPLFVETDATDGHTHRYQIKPDQLSSVTLYRLDGRSIEEWLGQLEGAISAESGLIVAALPGQIASAGESAHLQATVRALDPSATLQPEVYTIDPSGQLEVHTPLTDRSNRIISVQIPEGPALVSLTDANGQVTWSEIVFSSPGVVNLIGPN
jgi:hypothetical protein